MGALMPKIKELLLKENQRADLEDLKPQLLLKMAEYVPDLPKMKSQGFYPKGIPEGLIIHYTAGNRNQNFRNAITHANNNKHQYFFIDEAGKLYQQFDLNKWGHHAGDSQCPVTGRKNISRYYAGVEIACSGAVHYEENDGKKEFSTWFGKKIHKSETREFKATETQPFNGVFEKFTESQETTLLTLCLAMSKLFDIKSDFFLGHDEVSKGRKYDPGGSLSMSMIKFRELIQQRLELF